jgi:hypothetical protein
LEQGKHFETRDELLADMQLARDASVEKSRLALVILKRDYPSAKKLLRSRFALAKALGWGHQAPEGGKPKKKVGTDELLHVEDPEFDVNGPRHFMYRDADGDVVTKGDRLEAYRIEHYRDPARRGLARRLKASKSDVTLALRRVCIAGNKYNSLWATIVSGSAQADAIADVFAIDDESAELFARMWGTYEGATIGDEGDLPELFPSPTLVDGRCYFEVLFNKSTALDDMLQRCEAPTLVDVITSQLAIPSDVFPQFPLTDDEVSRVDFDAICPPYPKGAELDEFSEHSPKENRDMIQRVLELSGRAHGAGTAAKDVGVVADGVHSTEGGGGCEGGASEKKKVDSLVVSDELLRVFQVNYSTTSLTSHCDMSCWASGTLDCSQAHILSHGRVSKGDLGGRYGKYVKEGLPCKLDNVSGLYMCDWARAASATDRGAGSCLKLHRDWHSRRRWLLALSLGRVLDYPGNNLHFVLAIGDDDEAMRVRIVSYLTQSFGGVAIALGRFNPRAFEGLQALKKPGVLPPLTEEQCEWSRRARLFDVEDAEHQRPRLPGEEALYKYPTRRVGYHPAVRLWWCGNTHSP